MLCDFIVFTLSFVDHLKMPIFTDTWEPRLAWREWLSNRTHGTSRHREEKEEEQGGRRRIKRRTGEQGQSGEDEGKIDPHVEPIFLLNLYCRLCWSQCFRRGFSRDTLLF